MRASRYLLSTLKKIPTDTRIISHQLMLRSGMIRKISSGLYIWLPTGLRVLRKIKNIIHKEMNKIGAIEISLPMVQPADLWKRSGRFIKYGSELLKFFDRRKRLFVLAPTHEEIITNLISNEILSYKQLPLNVYQIQNKFRDEIRPRFGVLRSREFLMKDSYSFHENNISLQSTYNFMIETYKSIFKKMELNFCIIQANTGNIGGDISHEFQVLSDNGEDSIVYSTKSNYISNIELARTIYPNKTRKPPKEKMHLVDFPSNLTIKDLIKHFSLSITKTIKIFLVHAKKNTNESLIALIINGKHQLNIYKAELLPQVLVPLKFASEEEIFLKFGINSKSLGLINLQVPIIIDKSVALMSDFISGANINGKYFFGINWERDIPIPEIADLRKVVNKDISPDGKGLLKIKKGIEIGHIFQIGTKYSKILKAFFNDKNGHKKLLYMGCYGIGISRIISAIIEQNNDDRGIIWPECLSPFNVVILPINMYKYDNVKIIAESIYQKLQKYNIDVIFDDRLERTGVMFSDMELIGITHQLIISNKNLKNKNIEYRNRRNNEKEIINYNNIVDFLIKKIFI